MKSELSEKMSPGTLYPLNAPTSGDHLLNPSRTSTTSSRVSVRKLENSRLTICNIRNVSYIVMDPDSMYVLFGFLGM